MRKSRFGSGKAAPMKARYAPKKKVKYGYTKPMSISQAIKTTMKDMAYWGGSIVRGTVIDMTRPKRKKRKKRKK